ncbi:MAG TPA: hypothetical protein VJ752_08635 [Burkholderiaceae bacterium]|nr:hypothetical protein [Burkholderiaceae bacterium]
MTIRAIACGALLAIAGVSSAADMTYTYTGKLFEHNDITSVPSRLVAHFVFDFEHSPQAADNIYAIKHWDVEAAGLHFSEAMPMDLQFFRFNFDHNKKIVDWQFGAAEASRLSGFLSTSSLYGQPMDLAGVDVISGPWASVYNNPGSWTVSAVPEPAAYMTLVAGLVCVAGLRRRAGQRKAA